VTNAGHGVTGMTPDAEPEVELAEVPAPVRPRRLFARPGGTRAASEQADVRDILEGRRTPVVLRRDARIRRLLAVADLTAAAIAVSVALVINGQAPNWAAVAAPPLIVLLCKLGRLYDRDEHVVRKSTLDQAPDLLEIATLYALLTWLASDAFVRDGLDKAAVASLWGTLLLGLVALRWTARKVGACTATPERLLLLGDGECATRVEQRIANGDSVRAVLVGRVALEPDDRAQPKPLGPLADLDYILRAHQIERVVIAPSARSSDDQLDTIRLVKALGVKVSLLPRLFEVVGSSLEFDDLDGLTLLGLRRYGLSKTSWYLKRTFDIVGATAGLVVLAPVLTGIALAIRLTSSGPILFRQSRVGRRGECFEMLKFRTMYDGADREKQQLLAYNETEGLFKLADDPRVTRVGRFLRRTSLDELPQLINVLRGEMSLVGPRPLVEEEDRKIASWHHRRREGTPGMTGVWQVLGSARVPLDDMVKMDYLYRANWSLWLDVKVLLRTFVHVASRRGL
jgi:exopolysaccharide biosynthesis polyprenyl glycosylphosphotransferase